jgi:hypothetical protein
VESNDGPGEGGGRPGRRSPPAAATPTAGGPGIRPPPATVALTAVIPPSNPVASRVRGGLTEGTKAVEMGACKEDGDGERRWGMRRGEEDKGWEGLTGAAAAVRYHREGARTKIRERGFARSLATKRYAQVFPRVSELGASESCGRNGHAREGGSELGRVSGL